MPTNDDAWMTDGPDALDDGIIKVVRVLRKAGIDTFNSCQGGPGCRFDRSVVWFNGDIDEGFRAEKILMDAGFKVYQIAHFWHTRQNMKCPYWEISFMRGAEYQ